MDREDDRLVLLDWTGYNLYGGDKQRSWTNGKLIPDEARSWFSDLQVHQLETSCFLQRVSSFIFLYWVYT